MTYRPIHSKFGLLWLHRCPALDHGPDFVMREGVSIDAGAANSQVTLQGKSVPFHGHLFKECDGFRFSAKDRRQYPGELLDEMENIVNRALI